MTSRLALVLAAAATFSAGIAGAAVPTSSDEARAQLARGASSTVAQAPAGQPTSSDEARAPFASAVVPSDYGRKPAPMSTDDARACASMHPRVHLATR